MSYVTDSDFTLIYQLVEDVSGPVRANNTGGDNEPVVYDLQRQGWHKLDANCMVLVTCARLGSTRLGRTGAWRKHDYRAGATRITSVSDDYTTLASVAFDRM